MKKFAIRFINHEMRTPMNTLISGLQYLEDQIKEGLTSAKDFLETVLDLKQCCIGSTEMLNQLLTYDSIESGLQKLFKKQFSVLPFIEDVVHQFSLQVRRRTTSIYIVFMLFSICFHRPGNSKLNYLLTSLTTAKPNSTVGIFMRITTKSQ